MADKKEVVKKNNNFVSMTESVKLQKQGYKVVEIKTVKFQTLHKLVKGE